MSLGILAVQPDQCLSFWLSGKYIKIIATPATFEISRFYLVPVAEQAGLSLLDPKP